MVMENIDDSKRKPRRTIGTPSYYYRNKFALAWIAVGSALFATWACTPVFQSFNNRICDGLMHPSEEEINRRYLFNLSKPLPSREIEKHISAEKELHSQR